MDHRQTPCPDSDFSGYSDKRHYTGEHTIPWPPPSIHRHPSTLAAPLAALGCSFALLALGMLAGLGAYTLWQWL